MDELFRPPTSRTDEIATSIELLGCLLERQKAVYVAVPMTSGERFLRWFIREGRELGIGTQRYNTALHSAVFLPNCDAAAAAITEIRQKCCDYLISPISLNRPNWTQNDYRHLWGRVIERHVERAVFLDGWQYSSGCCYEFLVACYFGAITLRKDMTTIDLTCGLELIRRSIFELNLAGINTDFQETVVRNLRALQKQLASA